MDGQAHDRSAGALVSHLRAPASLGLSRFGLQRTTIGTQSFFSEILLIDRQRPARRLSGEVLATAAIRHPGEAWKCSAIFDKCSHFLEVSLAFFYLWKEVEVAVFRRSRERIVDSIHEQCHSLLHFDCILILPGEEQAYRLIIRCLRL